MEQAKIVVNNEISIDRLISLEKENASLKERVGSLKADKNNLEKKLTEEQKEVKIITARKKDSFIGTFTEIESIETRNLGDVEELVSKKYKSDIDKKDKEIKSLSNQIDDITFSYTRKSKELDNNYEDYRTDLKLEYDKKIKDLKEELKKVKEDKTDKQETERRNKEILDLKLRIKELEKAIKNLTSINIFKRVWNAILDTNARVVAQKEILEKKEEIEKIKCSNKFKVWFDPWTW